MVIVLKDMGRPECLWGKFFYGNLELLDDEKKSKLFFLQLDD